MSEASVELVPLGDRAWRFPLPQACDRRSLLTMLLTIEGIVDVVLAEDQGAAIVAEDAASESVRRALSLALATTITATTSTTARLHIIGVSYDGEDLPALAGLLGLTRDGLVALHAHRDYEVAMVGFMPGFAYLRGLDPRLVVARRDSPRTRVPARSVAIAAGYTGIYPFASPGGWHLLGEAVDFTPFDGRGAALAVGDRVRFEPVARASVPSPRATTPLPSASSRGPWLEVRAARGPALLIDGGRQRHMHEGVPHGGPMVRGALARANAAVGNRPGACAIEVYGALEVIARGGPITVGDDGSGARVLADGEVFGVATEGRARVRYVAVQGGFDVPLVLGGRGTMLMAGMGGFEGRALRRGDRLSADADAGADAMAEAEAAGDDGVVTIVGGPDAGEGELEALVGATFIIAAASDRTGTRLEGPPLGTFVHSAHDRKSGPMVRGAIERTPSGPIVLGPDHPTTGGYPVIAVVREVAMDRFFALPIGHRVRFVTRT